MIRFLSLRLMRLEQGLRRGGASEQERHGVGHRARGLHRRMVARRGTRRQAQVDCELSVVARPSSKKDSLQHVSWLLAHCMHHGIWWEPQWISFGDLEPIAERIKAAGILLMVQAQSVEQAVQAASWGADAIVAQVRRSCCLCLDDDARLACRLLCGHVPVHHVGAACVVPMQSNESGGHGAAASTTFCLVPEVVSAVAEHAVKCKGLPVPILAAGGVTTGRQVRCHISASACACVAASHLSPLPASVQVAATLALGAAGAVLGTRLAATEESLYSRAKKVIDSGILEDARS